MGDVRVLDEQGVTHVFPDGSTPEMIAKAMNVKPPQASQQQTLDPSQPAMQPISMVDRFKNAISSPANYAAAVKENAQQIPRFASAVAQDVKGMVGSPGAVAKTIAGPAFNVDDIKRLYSMAKGHDAPEPEFLDRIGGSLGINTQGVKESAEKGDLAGVVGHAALPVAATTATGESKPGADVAASMVNPAKEAFNRAKRIDATAALDAALPASSGVDVAKTFATPDVIQRIRETASRNGITEPTADNLKKSVDAAVVENRVAFRKYLDPVATEPATVPLMSPRVKSKLISNIEINNPDVAARIKSGETNLGDLDVIRQRINQDTKYPTNNSTETAMNQALKDVAGKIRERLYPAVEEANGLPADTLKNLKAEEGKFMQLQPLTDKYAAQISKYASKEETRGMLEKLSGGGRGAMGATIGSTLGATLGHVAMGPEGAAAGASIGGVAGRFIASREGKLAESSRLMRAVFGQN